MKNLSMLLHPFAIALCALIIGSFLVLNNEANADGTIPVWFHGAWSIWLGFTAWVAGGILIGYVIYKNVKKRP